MPKSLRLTPQCPEADSEAKDCEVEAKTLAVRPVRRHNLKAPFTFVYTIQPVVKPVVKSVVKPV